MMAPSDLAELRHLAHADAKARQKRRIECEGKHCFTSRADATTYLKRRAKHDIGIYRCSICRGWHVGSNETNRMKRIAKVRLRG